MVSASGWNALIPLRLASGSEANGDGEPPRTTRMSSGWVTSSVSSAPTRTQNGSGPYLRARPSTSR